MMSLGGKESHTFKVQLKSHLTMPSAKNNIDMFSELTDGFIVKRKKEKFLKKYQKCSSYSQQLEGRVHVCVSVFVFV